jgi:hypothetical protein
MLVMDEMAIKSGLDYCVQTGTYVGNITFPQHKGVVSKALVIMLGGITTRWKQIAAFYCTGDSTNGMILGDIPTIGKFSLNQCNRVNFNYSFGYF